MATFKFLPDDVLEAISISVGKQLAVVLPATLGANQEVNLFETVEIWILEAGTLTDQTNDLKRLAKPTGRWHHQIKVGNQPQAFAQTRPLGPDPESWSLVSVCASELAQKIDETIALVDEQHLDGIVRLLVVPAYHLHAFWIVDVEQRVIVIDCPAEYLSVLTPRRLFSAEEFLGGLRSVRHIEGLTANDA